MKANHLSSEEIAAIAKDPMCATSEQQQHLSECTECRTWSKELRDTWQSLHSDAAQRVAIEDNEPGIAICPWSERTMSAARGATQNGAASQVLQHHFESCEACRELYHLVAEMERETSAVSTQDRLRSALNRLAEYYGRALVSVHALIKPEVEPMYRNNPGEEPQRFTLKVGEDTPRISVTLQEQSENHRYNVQIEPPGASIDVFAADGSLLASYDQGTVQLFAAARTAYLVLQGKHFVQLTNDL